MRRVTRRQFLELGVAAATGAAMAEVPSPAAAWTGQRAPSVHSPAPQDAAGSSRAGADGFLDSDQRATLSSAVARLIPASGPGDWSAADLGVVEYIDNLLSGFDRDPGTGGIYPSGPFREGSTSGPGFFVYQTLSRAKSAGWRSRVDEWRAQYAEGLSGLDGAAGGRFASSPEAEQDLILLDMDLSGSQFFSTLFDHTMEGAYSHPAYGGNAGYRAWQSLGFGGDVHGVRFPTTGSHGPWNVYGGYAPEEMLAPGARSNEQPVVTPDPQTRW